MVARASLAAVFLAGGEVRQRVWLPSSRPCQVYEKGENLVRPRGRKRGGVCAQEHRESTQGPVVMGVPGSWGLRICRLKGNDEPEPPPPGPSDWGKAGAGWWERGHAEYPGSWSSVSPHVARVLAC